MSNYCVNSGNTYSFRKTNRFIQIGFLDLVAFRSGAVLCLAGLLALCSIVPALAQEVVYPGTALIPNITNAGIYDVVGPSGSASGKSLNLSGNTIIVNGSLQPPHPTNPYFDYSEIRYVVGAVNIDLGVQHWQTRRRRRKFDRWESVLSRWKPLEMSRKPENIWKNLSQCAIFRQNVSIT